MIETITPVVHGERSRYRLAVALHAAGATLSAGAVGLALGGLGALVGAPWELGAWVVAAVSALYALRELLRLPIPLPDRRRQVPAWWRTFFSPLVAAFLYGLGLGVGFLTFLSYGTLVAVASAALVSGDPLVGAALCAPFGLARGLSVTANRKVREVEQAAGSVDRLEAMARGNTVRVANGIALSAVALLALGIAT